MVVDNKTGKQALVILRCECIRTTGQECDRTIDVYFEPHHPETGKTLTKVQRVARARKLAKDKGWQTPKGVDECPRVHGFAPAPQPKAQPVLTQ
jgi:hypothetical protein